MTASTLVTDYSGLGLLAARPVTPNISVGATAIYYATDTALAYAWNGAAWVTVGAGSGLFSQVMSATPTSASTGLSTWVNQGSAAVADAATGVCITAPSNGTANSLRCRSKASSGAHKYTALVAVNHNWNNTQLSGGIGWSDGTKIQVLTLYTNSGTAAPLISVDSWTNSTTYSASPFNQGSSLHRPGYLMWMQTEIDATNVYYRLSYDGANFVEIYSVALAGSFLGVQGNYTSVLYFINPYTTNGTITLLSWAQV